MDVDIVKCPGSVWSGHTGWDWSSTDCGEAPQRLQGNRLRMNTGPPPLEDGGTVVGVVGGSGVQ